MNPLSPARKASLGMTAVLGIAVATGAGFALFNAHAAPVTALRPEAPAREAIAQPSAPMADEESSALSGSVLETKAAGQYTYLRLATSTGEIWAAVPSASVALGAQVTIENATKMTAFKSSTLKRTFDVIYFGTLATGSTKQAAAPRFSPADALDNEDDPSLPPGHPDIGGGAIQGADALPAGHPSINGAANSPHGPSANAPTSAVPAVAVAPATGSNAHVIAQLSAQLAGQRVRVRGQVTKVTAGVQGHTFFHLRDGKPGDPGQASDLVVTSDATPELGQVAIFEGTLRANVDIGIGYSYPILLENAVLIAE